MTTPITAIDELCECAASAVRHYLNYCAPADAAAHVQTNLGTVRGLADAAITDATGTVADRPRVHNVTLTGDGGIRIAFDAAGTLQRTVSFAPPRDDHHGEATTQPAEAGDLHAQGAGLNTTGAPGASDLASTPHTVRRDHHATFVRRNAAAIAAGYSSYGARRSARSTGIGLMPCDQH